MFSKDELELLIIAAEVLRDDDYITRKQRKECEALLTKLREMLNAHR